MARQSPTTTPAEPPEMAPLASEMLTGPRLFALKLRGTKLVWWRYASVVVLSSLLAGVAYAVLARHIPGQDAQPASLLTHVVNVMGGTFLGMFNFVVMWGLGRLGAGREGRAAEVYGATFALYPPLWLLSTVWSLLTPATAFQAVPGVEDVQRAVLQATAQTPAAFLLIVVTLLGTLAQFGLAFAALRVLSGSAWRAALGVALPLLPALVVQFANIAPLVVGR